MDPHNSGDETEDEKAPILIRNYRPSLIGRIRTAENIQCIEWIFIFLSILIILFGFGFTVYRMLTIDPGTDHFLFGILILMNLVFASYYILHGILLEQPYEIIVYVLTTFVIAVLITINFTLGDRGTYVSRLVRFSVTVLLSVPNVLLGFKIGWQYWDTGPYIFKAVGGDRRLQTICRTYLFGQSLLIFDAQAMLSCVILVIKKGYAEMTNEEITMFSSGIVFIGIWTVVGYVGMRKENLGVTWLFAVFSIIQPAYVLYLYVENLTTESEYSIRTNCAYFAGILLLLVHFTLLAVLPIIASNYGKGLKETIYGEESPNSPQQLSDSPAERSCQNLEPDAILPAD